MNVLANFYGQLATRLFNIKDVNDNSIIKHIDFWNQQFDADFKEVFDFPAVFLEYKSLPWQTTGKHKQLGNMQFDLHITSTTKAKSSYKGQFTDRFLAQLELLDTINYWITGWNVQDFFGSISRTGIVHDHYYSDIIKHVVSYRCTMAETSAMRSYMKLVGDKLVISLPAQ